MKSFFATRYQNSQGRANACGHEQATQTSTGPGSEDSVAAESQQYFCLSKSKQGTFRA